MNKVLITGRFTKDPDTRYTDQRMAVSRFTLAVDRRYSREGESTADFVPCCIYFSMNSAVLLNAMQGTKIALEGRIQTGSYTNRDGNKVYTMDVVADNVEFCERKSASAAEPRYEARQKQPADDGFMQIPDGIDEELPFN